MQKKILLTGWLRSDGEACGGGLSPGGRRAKGISWIVSSLNPPDSTVAVVDEQPLYTWQVQAINPYIFNTSRPSQPTNEVAPTPHPPFQNYIINGDAMYAFSLPTSQH